MKTKTKIKAGDTGWGFRRKLSIRTAIKAGDTSWGR